MPTSIAAVTGLARSFSARTNSLTAFNWLRPLKKSGLTKAGQEDIKWYRNYFAPLKIGDDLWSVRLIVSEHHDGSRFYDFEPFEMKRAESSNPQASPIVGEEGREVSALNVNMRDLLGAAFSNMK